MKHFYIAAAAVLFTVTSSYALPKLPSAKAERQMPSKCLKLDKRTSYKKAIKQKTNEGDALSMDLGYCEDPYMAFYVGGGEVKGAIQLPTSMLEEFKGNKITAIQVASPPDVSKPMANGYDYESAVTECTVWLSYGLDEAPFASSTGKISGSAFELSNVKLDTPIDITADKNLYVGVTYNLPDSESVFGIVSDWGYPDGNNTCYVYSLAKDFDSNGDPILGDNPIWIEAGDIMGNINVRAVIEGDNLPQNKILPQMIDVPYSMVPGKKYPLGFMFQNMGANKISSITMNLKIGDNEPTEIKSPQIIVGYDNYGTEIYGEASYRQYAIAFGEISYDIEGNNIPWLLSVTEINGNKLEKPLDVGEGTLLCIENGFPKKNVIEEGTGTWCGYCVVGIAGMEYMHETYADAGVIGIAVHTGDEMDVTLEGDAYYLMADYLNGVPVSYLNRNMNTEVYPSPEDLESAFLAVMDIPAVASLEGAISNVDDEGRTIKLSLSSEFVFDGEETPYSFAYTVIENNVGPYLQTNYLSGEADEDSYGFGSLKSKFRMSYKEVARNCSMPYGIDNSLPATIVKGDKYNFDTEIKLDDVSRLDSYQVVAMVINNKSGMIENALLLDSPTYNGIARNVNADSSLKVVSRPGKLLISSAEGNVKVFSIDGRMVSRLSGSGIVSVAPGTYIVADGKASRKIIVR